VENDEMKKTMKLTKAEKMLGRSEDYYSMSEKDRWEEDKRLGILDWDGTWYKADKILRLRKLMKEPIPIIPKGFVGAMYVEDCYTLTILTTFKGKDGFERSLSAMGIDSYETAVAMARYLGWKGDVKYYRRDA
jgi:hypothetical protein